MAWAALLKSAGSKAAMQSGKKMAMNVAKEAAVDKIKSKFKKKKVKGKDIAKKMLGGGGESSEKGGALVVRPSTSIVSSPAGGLVPTKQDEGGGSSLAVSNESKDLGLTPFMESVIGVKETVESIKDALNDNSKDGEKRLEKQRLLNSRLRKEEREEQLETKKPGLGIGKKLLAPATKAGKGFLEKLKTFFTNILLGMFVNALIGGARDVVVAFIAGYKAYRMAKDAVVKFVLKLRGNIVKGIKDSGKSLLKAGSSIEDFLGTVRTRLVQWIKNGIQVLEEGVEQGTRLGKKVLQAVKPKQRLSQAFQAANKFRKNPLQTLKSIKDSGIGQRVQQAGTALNKFRKNPLQTIKSLKDTGIGQKISKIKPGNIWKGIQNLGIKGFKAVKESGAGKFVSGKWSQISQWATNLQKNMMSNLDDMVKGGMETANRWGKKWNKFKDLATNPKKLLEVVKKALDGKVKNLLKKNPLINNIQKLKSMKPKEVTAALSKSINNLGKNKNFLKVTKGLKSARKLKIAGLDAVLAALLGLLDYVALGESPINAVLRASGALIGYTMGAAAGLAIPVPGASFVTGMAGAWAGEKAADVIAAALSKTHLGETPDPLMKDGRMWVRNPFSDEAKESRKQADESTVAKMGEVPKDDTSSQISQSASYEEGAEEEIIVIDSGQENQTASVSKAGETKFIPLDQGDGEVLNTLTNATLYKA